MSVSTNRRTLLPLSPSTTERSCTRSAGFLVEGAAVTVSVNVAVLWTPVVLALTVAGPGVAPAFRVGEVACPLVSVVAVAVLAPPGKLAEPDVTVNVTLWPRTGRPPTLDTVATSGAANAWLTGADCPDPDVAAICVAVGRVEYEMTIDGASSTTLTEPFDGTSDEPPPPPPDPVLLNLPTS